MDEEYELWDATELRKTFKAESLIDAMKVAASEYAKYPLRMRDGSLCPWNLRSGEVVYLLKFTPPNKTWKAGLVGMVSLLSLDERIRKYP